MNGIVKSRANTRENYIRDQIYPEEDEDDGSGDDDDDHECTRPNDAPIKNSCFDKDGAVILNGERDKESFWNNTCHQNHKASQTCFCVQNKLNRGRGAHGKENAGYQHQTTPDSTEPLETLDEEEVKEPIEVENGTRKPPASPEAQRLAPEPPPALPQPNPQDQIRVLRELLKAEREAGERRRQNNSAMQQYVQRLQMDFLRQQHDLVEALEFGHKLKAQKESQIATMEATLEEKNRLIEQLISQINDLDEAKLRASFDETLKRQQQLARVEEEQLQMQKEHLNQQLMREKSSNAQVIQQFQEKLDDQMRLHEREMANIRSRLAQTQADLDRVLEEPQNLVIKSLRENNSKLESQLDELNLVLADSQTKYDGLKKKLHLLVAEQEQFERKNQEEIDLMQRDLSEQRRLISELSRDLQDKQEVIQVLQFNLQRSEKRVKSLIGMMKAKEDTYKQLVGQIESKHSQEFERLGIELSSMQKQLADCNADCAKKQNELVKLKLEHDNQLESMRVDRDERLQRSSLERQRIEKELQSAEMRVVREIESTSAKALQIDQLQKEVNQFKEESKRLLIELTKSEAKLYAKQKEFDELLERHKSKSGCQDGASESDKEQLRRLQLELEEERRHTVRYKSQFESAKKDQEKMCIKLKIAETNLIKMTSSINREHTKMLRDYERKIDQIRSEQLVFDRNKLRYKRYSHKLKTYCEHLRKVHDHICNPNSCGYLIGSPKSDSLHDGLSKKSTSSSLNISLDEDKRGLLIDSDGCYSGPENLSPDYSDDLGEISDTKLSKGELSAQNKLRGSHQVNRKNQQQPALRECRFRIKRTGISPAASAPSLRGINKKDVKPNQLRTSTRYPSSTPLKSVDRNVVKSGQGQLEELHDYCYINEASFCSREGRAII